MTQHVPFITSPTDTGNRPVMSAAPGSGPARVGAYRLESLLGRGGMGEVFLAWDERLERHVALKRILPEPPPDERARRRFRREARAIARLSHPAIVQVFDLLDDGGDDCLVMEYVEGRSLVELIAAGDLDLDTVLRLGTEIAEGLAEAHARGLIHRDLKPENVRVTRSGHAAPGRAKILDFGLARLAWNEGLDGVSMAAALTESGPLVGTVHTMSPEQASGRPVDHRSDLFALGGLLYEMLAGRAPFRGANVLDTLRRVTGEEPEALAGLRPDLPPALVELVHDLLAKEPADRPPNARLVADALDRLRAASAGTEAPAPRPAAGTAPGADVDVDALPAAEPAASGAVELETAVRTLWLAELVDAPRLVESEGEVRAAEIAAHHDQRVRDLLERHGGREIDKSGGFFCLFERPFHAVACALATHHTVAELSAELGVELTARSAVHLGEVVLRHNPPEEVERGARPLEVEGRARALAERLVALASPRQTLLSHTAFDLARRAAAAGEQRDEDLVWLAHGAYVIAGVEEPLEVFEVGVEGFAPLVEPPDSALARRAVTFSDELVLGWRPARGQTVPRRPNWVLEQRLGEGGFGEAWLAVHESGEKRVFKFCFEASRLRALKREVTLFRLLKEALGHRHDIARVLDWNFDAAPYFLESEHTEGGDLTAWAEEQGGLDAVPLATRVELVAQVADALAAAHSVGVLHKDVKPANVLITRDREGRPRARLTDFGVGALVDRSQLEARGVPALGFTETLAEDPSTAGSRRYLAPELLEGRPASVQADLYSLGVLLYQVVAGDFSRVLAPGWRREVDDPLLAEDVALLVDGSADRRPASAGPVAERLRALDRRRAERRSRERVTRRRRRLRLGATVGAVLLAVTAVLAIQANLARRDAERLQGRAEHAREQAEDLIGFMLGDLQKKLQAIGRLDALDSAGEKALEYFDGLEAEDLDTPTLARHAKALNQIGDVRMAQGELDAALGLFQRSLAKTEELVDRDPDDLQAFFELGQSHFWVGNVFYRQRKWRDALAEMEAYLELSEQLHHRQPDNVDWLLEVAYAYNNVGALYDELGNAPLACDNFEKALDVSRRLVERDPSRRAYRLRWVKAQIRLGQALTLNGDLSAAHARYGEALAAARALYDDSPEDTEVVLLVATVDAFLGTIALALGDLEEAERHFSNRLMLLSGLVELEPENVEWRWNQGIAHFELAETLFFRKDIGQALGHLRAAIGTTEALREASDERSQIEMDQVQSFKLLAEAQLIRGELDAARVSAEQAEALIRETQAWARRVEVGLVLGRVLARQGLSAEAQRVWRASLEEVESHTEGSRYYRWLDLRARALLHLGQLEAARSPIYTLLGMGYRHPRFMDLCARTGGDLCRS